MPARDSRQCPIGRVDQSHDNSIFPVEHGRVGRHAQAAAGNHHFRRQVPEIPLARRRMVPRPVLELAGGSGRLSGELSAQSIQALVDSQSLSPFIHHSDLHDQMGWQAIQLKGVHGNAFTADFLQHAGERGKERTLPEGQLRDHLAGGVRGRDQARDESLWGANGSER